MNTHLAPCVRCRRHHLATEDRCPFCEGETRRARGLGAVVLAVMTPVVLAACYGAPPGSWDTGPDELTDLDEDGFLSDVDCDDGDANVNPEASEVCGDEVDNDCDELVDDLDDCV